MKIEPEHRRRIGDYFAHFREYKAGVAAGEQFIRIRRHGRKKEERLEITDTDKRWLEVIEQVIRKFDGTPKQQLLYKRFVRNENEVKISRDLYIDRSTFYLWQHEIYEYAYMLAVSKQLLRVE